MDPFVYIILLAMVAVLALWLVSALDPSNEADKIVQGIRVENNDPGQDKSR